MRYEGSCHCGNVAFEVEGEFTEALDCNCSLCRRRGVSSGITSAPIAALHRSAKAWVRTARQWLRSICAAFPRSISAR
ncbi:hypothetical protein JOH50_004219 [Rhizobium leguminosarum]|nr:hypothetical protein [Rhizobium leguminosarum]